jgi:prevent-host-death family protein
MVTKNESWALAEAKARLTEVVERAQEAPQIIERRGRPVGVLLGVALYEEREALAARGSAQARMSRFLEAAAAIRDQGGIEIVLPKREPRRSPFASR